MNPKSLKECSMSLLLIRERSVSDVVVLEISGRLTIGRDCQQVEWRVEDLVREKKTKLVLDLSGVGHVDGAGIGIIIMCYSKAKRSGGRLRLAGINGLEEIFRSADLNRIFQFYPTAEAAAESFAISSLLDGGCESAKPVLSYAK
jgi:anti-sigma B factor antagonist